MHDNGLESINPESRFQWYPVARLAADLSIIELSGQPLINLATEPVATHDLHSRYFHDKLIGKSPSPQATYDMHTRYASLLAGRGSYFMDRADVIVALGDYLTSAN
jgi:hypothetical protein